MMPIGARGYKVAMLIVLEVSTCPIPLPEAPRTYLILNLSRTCIVLLLRRSLRASWGGSVVIKLVVFEKSLLMRGRISHAYQFGG